MLLLGMKEVLCGMCFVAGDGSVDQHQVGLRSVAAGRATKNKEKHQTGGGGVTGF